MTQYGSIQRQHLLVLFVAGASALGAIVNASDLSTMLGQSLGRAMQPAPGDGVVDYVSLFVIALVKTRAHAV
ncbi:MAG: hypothetical protein P4L82_19020 [Ancalomicrobiaceae bacterium]|nr:hypothetical protein [Ancalomicrobiaceae bacterium]